MRNTRTTFIYACTIVSAAVVLTTELLSLAHGLTRPIAYFVWIPAAILAAGYLRRVVEIRLLQERLASLEKTERAILWAIGLIIAVNLALALLAAPSTFDALSYHVPRLHHWIQNRSLAHYPTHIDRQLWIGPGWEYFAVNLELLAGGNQLVNCVEWLSFIGCVIVSSQLARQIGATRRGQMFAALFTATLPMAIAQASGSQVDLFASFWLACAASLILDQIGNREPIALREALVLGTGLGLAVLSKATAFIFLSPLITWLAVVRISRDRRRVVIPILVAVAAAFVVNAGIYSRNYALYGTVLGRTSGPPLQNAIITPRAVASNIVRNLAIHGRSPFSRVNVTGERVVNRIHSALHIDPSDVRTTYANARFTLQKRPRSEGYIGNPLHLLLIAFALLILCFTKAARQRMIVGYAIALVTGFVLFCAFLRWQPWHTRLHLPLFVLAAALTGTIFEKRFPALGTHLVGALLFVSCLPVLFVNTMRPIVSSRPIWSVPREQRYFIETPGIYAQYVAASRLLASRGCSHIGLVTSPLALEELLWEVMRNRAAKPVRITHISVKPSQEVGDVCAIVANFDAQSQRSPLAQVPSGWSLVFDRAPLQIYVKSQANVTEHTGEFHDEIL